MDALSRAIDDLLNACSSYHYEQSQWTGSTDGSSTPPDSSEIDSARKRIVDLFAGPVPGAVGVSVETQRATQALKSLAALDQSAFDFLSHFEPELMARARAVFITPRTVVPDPASGADGVLVPEDPTDSMVAAGAKVDFSNEDERGMACNVWNAMLAARPSSPNTPIRGAGSSVSSVVDRADGDSERAGTLGDLSPSPRVLRTTQEERDECRLEAISTSRKAQVVALPIHGVLSLLDDADLAADLSARPSSPRDAGEAETVEQLRREIERISKALADAHNSGYRENKRANDAEARVADLERQLAGAVEALKPFADIAGGYADRCPVEHPDTWRVSCALGDTRAATTILASLKESSRGV